MPSTTLTSMVAAQRRSPTNISETEIAKPSTTLNSMVSEQRRSPTNISENEISKPSATLNSVVAAQNDSLRVAGQGWLRADEHDIDFK